MGGTEGLHTAKEKGTCIDKQKALRRDCIYNIENTDAEKGVSGIYLHLSHDI